MRPRRKAAMTSLPAFVDEGDAVAGVTLDAEELAERGGGVAVLHGESRDLGGRLAGKVVRGNALRLDGAGRRSLVGQSQHETLLRPRLTCLPSPPGK
jgi:hypothetical protein